MAKLVKIKCAFTSAKNSFFTENRLYKGKIADDGSITVKDNYGVNFGIDKEKMNIIGDINGEKLEIRFVVLKTKTIKCTFVDHSIPVKKSFKLGKRYQIESGRVLGGVAGYVFDEDGDRWTLFREEVGFSAGGCYLFEAMYS